MNVETFAKKVLVTIHPSDHMFTVLVQFGEHDDEVPYPLLVEMPLNTAMELKQELEEWIPFLQAKIKSRHTEQKEAEV